MKLSAFKEYLQEIKNPLFVLESGEEVPAHYHLTEIGLIHKKFIDCGGLVREEDIISFQLWYAHDIDHCLTAEKTLKIIQVFEEKISSLDAEIEVEYQ